MSALKSRARRGRPRVDPEVRKLIRDMWRANPTWGKPRIQAELRKIGIEVSDSTVRRYRPPRYGPPSQSWRSFLENHVRDIAAIDFFVVPTVTFRVLYVLVIMSHDGRRIPHFNATTSPSARWTARQVVEAMGDVVALAQVGGLHHRSTSARSVSHPSAFPHSDGFFATYRKVEGDREHLPKAGSSHTVPTNHPRTTSGARAMSPTRRAFVATSASAAAATLLNPAFARARQAQEAQAVFTPIRGGVGYFTMRGGTIGYQVNADAVAVVDSQFPEQATALIAGLEDRSGGRAVDCLINTHHHGDHTGGNIAFRGKAKQVVAHAKAAEHMRNPPGAQPPADQLYPDVTFTESWSTELGDEKVWVRHYGRAHTSGDIVVTFERANVAHMGDLVFHRRHPVVDRAAGATLRGWMAVLDRTLADHPKDTVYIFGHAAMGLPPVGSWTDLVRYHDYIGAVLNRVGAEIRAGKSRDDILAMQAPLPGFEDFGPFGNPGAREIRSCAYEEITTGA